MAGTAIVSSSYMNMDEAFRDSATNAERMRADCGIMACLEAGEPSGKGDYEYALFARLKQGFQPPPSKHAPEVMELAMQMAGPRFLEDGAQLRASER